MRTLSRRERQILDILYARGRATAADVHATLPDPPSYSSVRALLRVLEQKGHVRHEADGPRYVFFPRLSRGRARKSALRHLLQTFFDGSAGAAVVALLDADAATLTPEQLARIEALIDRARKGETS
jgi:BlaI family transcriptional regulator, penicillinase repressor